MLIEITKIPKKQKTNRSVCIPDDIYEVYKKIGDGFFSRGIVHIGNILLEDIEKNKKQLEVKSKK